MNGNLQTSEFELPGKDAVIRARCSRQLKLRLKRIAAFREKEISDLIRDAVLDLVMNAEQKMRAA